MQVSGKALLKGMATYLPGMTGLACRYSGGTVSARYCYAVWLRHLVLMRDHGLATRHQCVAELGPGDSLGIGLCALLSGADSYYALDTKPHARPAQNLKIFEELIGLFQRRTSIPNDAEFPRMHPRLKEYGFPGDILSEELLAAGLRTERLHAIRIALKEGRAGNVRIRYVAPWDDASLVEPGAIDLVFSQAVMEHVENVQTTYDAIFQWLRPGGIMSHEIDYKSHFCTRDWNGHWTVPDFVWKLVKGRRPYLINRLSHSAHVAAMRKAGFAVVGERRNQGEPIARNALAARFKDVPDEDLRTSGCLVQAVKT